MFELERGVAVFAGGQAQLDLVGRPVPVDPGHREQAGRFAAQDLATRVARETERPADAEIAGDREEPAAQPLRVGAGLPDVLDRRVVAPADEGGAGLARRDAATPDFAVRLGEPAGIIGHVLPRPSCPAWA